MNPFRALQEEVCRVNRELPGAGLVTLTWGNASGADRALGVMAIKPSGVPYAGLEPRDLVVLRLDTGEILAGGLRPSSDAPTHRRLYLAFPGAGGIVHTHSPFATAFAQAGRELPCLGTTHADHFHGAVPLARPLEAREIETDYELHTGTAIADAFRDRGLDPARVPAALVPGHAPFAWGPTPAAALENAIVLEASARMALHTLALNPGAAPLPRGLLDRHFFRKHGPSATYGQEAPHAPN